MRTLRRFAVALWLAAFVLPVAPVLCIGATGHIEFEFLNDECCAIPIHSDCTGIEACPADNGCGDCSDIALDRDSLAGRRDAALQLTGAMPLAAPVACVLPAHSTRLLPIFDALPRASVSGASALASTVIRC